jgi:dTDP-4-amino-4,6-dideoxygalactose transaminase
VFDVVRPGLTSRLGEAAAAMGRVQLGRLPALLEERRVLAARYRERLAGLDLGLQADAPGRSWQTFAVLLPESVSRDGVRRALAAQGIETQVASYGLHTLAAYRAVPSAFPVADALHHRALALPLWNGLSTLDLDRVTDALRSALG